MKIGYAWTIFEKLGCKHKNRIWNNYELLFKIEYVAKSIGST